MRRELWPGADEDHRVEIAAYFAGTLPEPEAVLVAETGQRLVGVAELSIRDEIPGLEHQRIGYLEGLYVLPDFRNLGVARRLLEAARSWAREKACKGFASDRAERIIVDRRFGTISLPEN